MKNLNKIKDIQASIIKQKTVVEKVMDDVLDNYLDKKISRKEMRTLMKNSSKLWLEMIEDLEKTEDLINGKS